MMPNKHKIESCNFNIMFGSETCAFEKQDILTSFINNRLMHVIEEEFDEYSEPNNMIQYNRLDIDLGEILISDFPDELENRMRSKLRSLLKKKRFSRDTGQQPGTEKFQTRQQADLEMIIFFLNHGFLPWNAGFESDDVLIKTFDLILETRPESLTRFFRHAPSVETVVKRVVHQFPEYILKKILSLLVQQSDVHIFGYMKELWDTFSFGSHGIHFREVKKDLWESLFCFI